MFAMGDKNPKNKEKMKKNAKKNVEAKHQHHEPTSNSVVEQATS